MTLVVTTTDFVPGKEVSEIIGVVRGNTIQAKNIGKDIRASFKQIVGGEIREYTEMMSEAREIAYRRMIEKGDEMDADAIINVRFMTSSIMAAAAEILVYGTAVKLK
ncbi:MAG: YbjQ family protein [Halobacteriota archaeon]|nr:YbjQ family protein [Halobacteriota archaeon]